MIRPARFRDIPGLVDFIEARVAASIYAGASFDRDLTARTLEGAIAGHGTTVGHGATCVFVAEGGGLILGIAGRIYGVLALLEATEFIWTAIRPRDGVGLLRAFLAWAEAQPGLVQIRMTTNDALADPVRTGRLLDRHGLSLVGGVYMRRAL